MLIHHHSTLYNHHGIWNGIPTSTMGFQMRRPQKSRLNGSQNTQGLKLYMWCKQVRPEMFAPIMPYIPVYCKSGVILIPCIWNTLPCLYLGMTPPWTTWRWQHDSNGDRCQDSMKMKVSGERDKSRNKSENKGKKERTNNATTHGNCLYFPDPTIGITCKVVDVCAATSIFFP